MSGRIILAIMFCVEILRLRCAALRMTSAFRHREARSDLNPI